MILSGYGLTHQGNVRQNNEDNFYLFGKYKNDVNMLTMEEECEIPDELALVGVFDGMGGEEAGEIASLIAAEGVSPSVIETAESSAKEQIFKINEKVCEEIRIRQARVGTTAVLLYFDKGEAVSINIGDSRSYCLRNGRLIGLSKDHSEGQSMVDMGVFTEEEAKKNKAWHKLTQHIGIFPEEFIIEPYSSGRMKTEDGDIYLLCSDGLTDMLSNEEIAAIMKQNSGTDLSVMAHALRDAALNAGGKDNVTVVLVRVCNKAGNNNESNGKKILKNSIIGIPVAAMLLLGIVLGVKAIRSEDDETKKTRVNTEKEVVSDNMIINILKNYSNREE